MNTENEKNIPPESQIPLKELAPKVQDLISRFRTAFISADPNLLRDPHDMVACSRDNGDYLYNSWNEPIINEEGDCEEDGIVVSRSSREEISDRYLEAVGLNIKRFKATQEIYSASISYIKYRDESFKKNNFSMEVIIRAGNNELAVNRAESLLATFKSSTDTGELDRLYKI